MPEGQQSTCWLKHRLRTEGQPQIWFWHQLAEGSPVPGRRVSDLVLVCRLAQMRLVVNWGQQ